MLKKKLKFLKLYLTVGNTQTFPLLPPMNTLPAGVPDDITECMKLLTVFAFLLNELHRIYKKLIKQTENDEGCFDLQHTMDSYSSNALGDLFDFYSQNIGKFLKDPHLASKLATPGDKLHRESEYYNSLTPKEVCDLVWAPAIDCALSKLYFAACDHADDLLPIATLKVVVEKLKYELSCALRKYYSGRCDTDCEQVCESTDDDDEDDAGDDDEDDAGDDDVDDDGDRFHAEFILSSAQQQGSTLGELKKDIAVLSKNGKWLLLFLFIIKHLEDVSDKVKFAAIVTYWADMVYELDKVGVFPFLDTTVLDLMTFSASGEVPLPVFLLFAPILLNSHSTMFTFVIKVTGVLAPREWLTTGHGSDDEVETDYSKYPCRQDDFEHVDLIGDYWQGTLETLKAVVDFINKFYEIPEDGIDLLMKKGFAIQATRRRYDTDTDTDTDTITDIH